MDISSVISNLPSSVQVLLILGAFWLLNKLWDAKQVKDRDQATALNECTTAILRLEIQIKLLNENIAIIPKLKSDIDAAHEKLRIYGQPKSDN